MTAFELNIIHLRKQLYCRMATLKRNRNLEFTNEMISKKQKAGFFNTVSHDLHFIVLLKFYK